MCLLAVCVIAARPPRMLQFPPILVLGHFGARALQCLVALVLSHCLRSVNPALVDYGHSNTIVCLFAFLLICLLPCCPLVYSLAWSLTCFYSCIVACFLSFFPSFLQVSNEPLVSAPKSIQRQTSAQAHNLDDALRCWPLFLPRSHFCVIAVRLLLSVLVRFAFAAVDCRQAFNQSVPIIGVFLFSGACSFGHVALQCPPLSGGLVLGPLQCNSTSLGLGLFGTRSIHLFIHSFSFIQSFTLVCSFIHSFIHVCMPFLISFD